MNENKKNKKILRLEKVKKKFLNKNHILKRVDDFVLEKLITLILHYPSPSYHEL